METYKIVSILSGIVGLTYSSIKLFTRCFPKKKISWKTAEKSAKRIANKLLTDGFHPTMIFGIGRGGAIFGSMISGCIGHCPLIVIDRQHNWSESGRIDDIIFPIIIPTNFLKCVLLVSGPIYTGGTIKVYYDHLLSIGAKEIKRAALLLQEGSPASIEYYGIKATNTEILLPWMFTDKYIREDKVPRITKEKKPKIILYLIRHAETEASDDIFSGRDDYDLTVKGIEQALYAGRVFIGKKIASIFSSPLKRALKTATIIKHQIMKSDILIDNNLREMDYGSWDGISRKQIIKENPDIYNQWLKDPVTYCPDRSESPNSVLLRLKSFLSQLEHLYCNVENEIITVSHKATIRILLCHVEGKPINEYRNINIRNCEIVTLGFDGKLWSRIDTIY